MNNSQRQANKNKKLKAGRGRKHLTFLSLAMLMGGGSALSSGILLPEQQSERLGSNYLSDHYGAFHSVSAALPALRSSTPVSSKDGSLVCLGLNIYWEARNQNVAGQLAVAQVTMNRVNDPRYPDDVCEVVYDHKQFSWYWDGKSDTPKEKKAWEKAMIVASAALHGSRHAELQGVTHYHAVYTQPYWKNYMTKVTMIGAHVFYVE
jgi:spore germination cell wall hydrolase CwlJ-like protein